MSVKMYLYLSLVVVLQKRSRRVAAAPRDEPHTPRPPRVSLRSTATAGCCVSGTPAWGAARRSTGVSPHHSPAPWRSCGHHAGDATVPNELRWNPMDDVATGTAATTDRRRRGRRLGGGHKGQRGRSTPSGGGGGESRKARPGRDG